jgi:hypothetical protein
MGTVKADHVQRAIKMIFDKHYCSISITMVMPTS